VRYIESSALVAGLLEHDAAVIKETPRGTQQVTSALTLTEAGRAIIRARATGRLTAEQEQAAVKALRRLSGAASSSTLIKPCSIGSAGPIRSNRFARSTPFTLRLRSCSARRHRW
jgi:hypothetical protein